MSYKQRKAWARHTTSVSDCSVSIIGVLLIFADVLTLVKSEKASEA